jgi:hypothetical protein
VIGPLRVDEIEVQAKIVNDLEELKKPDISWEHKLYKFYYNMSIIKIITKL